MSWSGTTIYQLIRLQLDDGAFIADACVYVDSLMFSEDQITESEAEDIIKRLHDDYFAGQDIAGVRQAFMSAFGHRIVNPTVRLIKWVTVIGGLALLGYLWNKK